MSDWTRLRETFVYATEVHADQRRKGSGVPYLGHLFSVCGLVLDDGGSETEAIAALLHDAAEDCGGRERLADIEARFGPDVAAIVEALSDTLERPKPPWRPRKKAYLEHLRSEEHPGVIRVSLADKVVNAQAILADHRVVGDEVYDRFTASKADTLWYYRKLAEIFSTKPGHERLARELQAIVDELRRR